jgi:HK97 family phage prohead protease
MKMKHKSFAIHDFKMDDEARTVEGWASTFGGIDSYGDTIVPGAFAESIKIRKPKMLWQHDSRQVIGVWDSATETEHGLYIKGHILDTTLGNDAYKLAKAGAIDSMSIGYAVKESTYDQKTGIRSLKKIDLWEVSLVTFPANEDAAITMVKAAMEDIDEATNLLDQVTGMCDAYASGDMSPTAEAMATVAQMVRQAQGLLEDPEEDAGEGKSLSPKRIERILREAGMSRGDARGVIAKGYNAIATPREAGPQVDERFLNFINSLK